MAYALSKSATAFTALDWIPLISGFLRKVHILPPPKPTPLQASDTLWLYDNIAFPSLESPSGWTAEFIAAYFLANSGKNVAAVVADISEKLGLVEGDAAEARIAERVQPFLDLVLEARTVEVEFAGQGRVHLGPSGAGGVSVNDLPLPGGPYRDGEEVISTALLPPGIDESKVLATVKTRFAGKDGWGIVSGSLFLFSLTSPSLADSFRQISTTPSK